MNENCQESLLTLQYDTRTGCRYNQSWFCKRQSKLRDMQKYLPFCLRQVALVNCMVHGGLVKLELCTLMHISVWVEHDSKVVENMFYFLIPISRHSIGLVSFLRHICTKIHRVGAIFRHNACTLFYQKLVALGLSSSAPQLLLERVLHSFVGPTQHRYGFVEGAWTRD